MHDVQLFIGYTAMKASQRFEEQNSVNYAVPKVVSISEWSFSILILVSDENVVFVFGVRFTFLFDSKNSWAQE